MIKIGTSGYSYKDWIGTYYPEDIEKGDMLPYYAKQFNFTEINSTYYKLPNPFMMNHLLKKTDEKFHFSVKVHQSMTHSRDADETIYSQFKDAIKPLSENGRLACLLVQFPYSFHLNRQNFDYIRKMREYLKDYDICMEFRNNKWICQATFDLLKEQDLSYVCVDEPNIKGLINPVVVATNSVGYVRFHGRNKDKWYNHKQSYERYNYLYSEEELNEWIPRIETLKKKTDRLYIAFNNHFRAQGVQNAQMLKGLL